MKKLLLLLLSVILLTGCVPEGRAKNPGPEIFLISLEKCQDYGGRDVWLFNYALDGAIHQAVFNDAALVKDYIKYLETVGNITGGAE